MTTLVTIGSIFPSLVSKEVCLEIDMSSSSSWTDFHSCVSLSLFVKVSSLVFAWCFSHSASYLLPLRLFRIHFSLQFGGFHLELELSAGSLGS